MSLRDRVAMAIYHAAFMPSDEAQRARRVPSPGWCWEKASEQQREFCRRQAIAAIDAMNEGKVDAREADGIVTQIHGR